jgi:hypothetical protein
MDPEARAVEAVSAPALDTAPFEPPTPVDSPPVAPVLPMVPAAEEPPVPLQAFRFVDPPAGDDAGAGEPPRP